MEDLKDKSTYISYYVQSERKFTEDELAELKELIERMKQEPLMLFEAPPEDMVKVVRCKDCIHYEARQKNQPWNSSRKYCNRQVILCTGPNDFCSFAERRTDGSD